MHTVNILRYLVEHHQELIYFLIFFGLVIEGEFVLMSTGILLHLGALNFYVATIFIFLGLFSKTLFGYYLGCGLHNKWNHARFLKYIEKRVLTIMPNFKEKPFWSIFVSKFIIGANGIVIIFSGYQKIEFKKYFEAEALSTLIWAPVMIILGYFFSYTALHVSHEVWRFSFIVLLFVLSFILIDKLIGWVYEIFEGFYEDAK